MKIYHVYVHKYGYDEFDGLIVVAENKDRALEMVKVGYYGECYFKERQGKIHIEEVDLTTEHIVLESYNAG